MHCSPSLYVCVCVCVYISLSPPYMYVRWAHVFVRAATNSAVRIQPHNLLGVVGEHEDFPIERIRISANAAYLGSCSHDNSVKFWNLEGLFDEVRVDTHTHTLTRSLSLPPSLTHMRVLTCTCVAAYGLVQFL